MNDLRHDPDAHAIDPRVMPVAALRTVPMPDLRSPQARALDAQARGLDCRTGDDKLRAELVRIVDVAQALVLRVEMLEEVIFELAKAAGIQEAL